jgi:hypothetical protein
MMAKPTQIRYVPYEEYADTFSDFQQNDDRNRWRGSGTTIEFPHNPGSYEEKIDKEQGRKIIEGSY